MDLVLGYWQVELSPSEQEKCAIITFNRLYQPTYMLQGLCNAPATFQQIMGKVLYVIVFVCIIYLNNTYVFSFILMNILTI